MQPFQTVTINDIDTNPSDFNIIAHDVHAGRCPQQRQPHVHDRRRFNPASSGNKSGQLLVDTSSGTLASALTGRGLER